MDKLIEDNRRKIVAIAEKFGAENIRAFGSMMRGDAGSESDVDILVDMKEGSTLLDIIAIKQDIEELLHRKVDVVTKASISPYIREEVMNQAVNL